MNVRELFQNEQKLNKAYKYYIKKKQIISEKNNSNLIFAHLSKAEHNIKLLDQLNDSYNDWKIVGLYYALYHASLALVLKKGFISKNHSATIVFLIKHYSEIGIKDIELIEQLQIKEKDAILYTELKKERENASYSSSFIFDKNIVSEYLDKTISYLNKIKEIINN